MSDSIIIFFTVFVSIIAIYSFVENKQQQQLLKRQIRLERKLQQLLDHFHIQEEENAQIVTLVEQGKKIEAIKLARELFGYSLEEAKQYVDQLENPSK
jgi:ribosomal protein L7/L12